jgi:hypothetical protein
MQMRLIAGVVATAVALSSGCAMTFQSHLPAGSSPTSARDAQCSESRLLPWIDTGFLAAELATAGVGVAISTGAINGNDTKHDDQGKLIAGVALAVAVLQLASAGNGFERARQCRAAHAAPAETAQR